MASEHSYSITFSNNSTEKEALDFLVSTDKQFLLPTKEGRKEILRLLNIEHRYSRAFDLVIWPGHTNIEENITADDISKLVLVELKTTKKFLPNFPKGFFFGATQNEFDLAKALGNHYKFCFVSLHPDSKQYSLISLDELDDIIVTKRIQYQINL